MRITNIVIKRTRRYNPGMSRDSYLPVPSARRDPLAEDDAQGVALRALVLGMLVVGLVLYCLAVWFDWLPWLRGWGNYPQGWTWALYPQPPLVSFAPVVAAIAAIWAGITLAEFSYRAPWMTRNPADTRAVQFLFLVLMVFLGYALQLGLLGLKSDNPNRLLVERVTNRVFTGYFNLAASARSADALLSGYPNVFATRVCPHCHDHPPGPALYYWLNIQAAESLPADTRRNLAATTWRLLGESPGTTRMQQVGTDAQILGAFWGGSLILVLASLIVVPLFGLARILGPSGYEFRLAGLGLTLPGLMLMTPEFDQVFALVSALAVYLGLRGLRARNAGAAWPWAAAAGIVISAGLLFSWALVVVLAAVAALGVIWAIAWRSRLFATDSGLSHNLSSQFAAWLAALGAGAILPLVTLALTTGTNLLYILQYNLSNAARAEAQRPYEVWVFYGPLDFLQFLGLPLALAAAVALASRSRQSPKSKVQSPKSQGGRLDFGLWTLDSRSPWYTGLNPYALLFWAILVGLDLAGRSKAEQGRLLIFLMPLALMAVYLWAARTRPQPWAISQLFFAQMLVLTVIGARWFVP
jgi:hypothetical protein